jgi:hypothetical protein
MPNLVWALEILLWAEYLKEAESEREYLPKKP